MRYLVRSFFFFLSLLPFCWIQGDTTTFSRDRITGFYTEFVCEEKDTTAAVNLTPDCSSHGGITPTPPPPPPPAHPVAPTHVKGYFPIVVSNLTTQPNDQVYVTVVNNSLTQILYLKGSFPGQMAIENVSSTTFTPDFAYPLTSFPTSTTGADDFLIYMPNAMNAGRITFSIGTPVYMLNNTPTLTLTAPPSYVFYDPNFNVLNDFVELTITKLPAHPTNPGQINYQPFIDTTQVDNLGLPIKLGFYTLNTAAPTVVTPYIPSATPSTNPTGFSLDRDTLFGNIIGALTSPWDDLAIPFYTDPYSPGMPTTYLRILAPKTATTTTPNPLPQPVADYAIPQFPLDYITSPTNYLDTLFAFYSGGPNLYIQADGTGSGEIYSGSVTGMADFRTFTFTSTHYTITLSEEDTTTKAIYGTTLPFVSADAPALDVIILQKYFGAAFSAGLLGVSGTFDVSMAPLNGTTLITHCPGSGGVEPLYYLPSEGYNGYNLYAQNLHANAVVPQNPPTPPPLSTEGLCYAFDYDDVLTISSTLSLPASTLASSNVYAILTLESVPTVPTGVFDDPTTYTLTFTIPMGPPNNPNTLLYRQGNSGAWLTASSSVPITGVVSTDANPFQINYNGLLFTIFPKYQFLQPINAYTTAHNAVIGGAVFTPNVASAPTAFTISHLPSH